VDDKSPQNREIRGPITISSYQQHYYQCIPVQYITKNNTLKTHKSQHLFLIDYVSNKHDKISQKNCIWKHRSSSFIINFLNNKGYSWRAILTTGPWPMSMQCLLRNDGNVCSGVWQCIICSSLIYRPTVVLLESIRLMTTITRTVRQWWYDNDK